MRMAAIVVCVGVLGCGARTGYDDELCQGPELLSTPLRGSDAILTGETCSFVTEQDGHAHRILCDGNACRWHVDDALRCTCEQLDYSNTCANGITLCADWRDSFDFSAP
jgi:hypothetical protein